VLEARWAPVVDDDVDAFVHGHEERASEAPLAIDTSELRRMDRDRLTVLSTYEIAKRKQRGALVVGGAIGVAIAVLGVAGLTQALPMRGGDRLSTTSSLGAARSSWSKSHPQRTLSAETTASHDDGLSISVDALPKAVALPKAWPKPVVKPMKAPKTRRR
jgi:hypothetical protein